MKKIYVFMIGLICTASLFAQEADKGLIYDDKIYVENIYSVKFHIPGVVVSYPMVNLGASGVLVLSFDDLDGGVKNYRYSVVHCNMDWTPSDLTEMEYMDGFNDEEIEDYDYSFNTLTDYTHYRFTLPNENFKFTKSGNYLLKIYEDEDEKRLVVTRRFMVVEPRFIVQAEVMPTSMVSKIKTHQEIDFTVSHKGIRVSNQRNEINVVVMQNGRWDNAIVGLKPQFIKGETLIYDLMDKVVFPAGKEFRYVDLRTLRYRTEKVKAIEEFQDGYDVTLYTDKMRTFSFYSFIRDINGGFVIGNIENDANMSVVFNEADDEDTRNMKLDLMRRQLIENDKNNNIESDYANVLFSLEMKQPIFEKDVYLFGAFTDWKIKKEFKMTYEDRATAYVADIFLKQGFYNYKYVTVPRKKGADQTPNLEELEGNWYETENQYTVLVYYRPFGSRYDHLVAAYTFDSLRN